MYFAGAGTSKASQEGTRGHGVLRNRHAERVAQELTLSKTLGLLVPSPFAWSLLAFAVGLVLSLRRRSRAAAVVIASGMALLLTCSTPRFASWLLDLTERDAPRTYREGTVYDAVIVPHRSASTSSVVAAVTARATQRSSRATSAHARM